MPHGSEWRLDVRNLTWVLCWRESKARGKLVSLDRSVRAMSSGMTKSLSEIIPVLQVAIGPVILISGVGLLLLSLTNRFARILDRARLLAREIRNSAASNNPENQGLIRMLHRRALCLRASIALASTSVLFAAVLIILLFVQALMGGSSALFVVCTFIICLLSLIGSVVAFLWDIHLSMLTLKLELEPAMKGKLQERGAWY